MDENMKTVLNVFTITVIVLAVCTFFMPDQIGISYVPDGDLHYFSRYWIFLLTPVPLLILRRWRKRKKDS